MNIISLTDSYKQTHWQDYPKKTEKVYAYFEARNGATYNKTMFFGLQYFLKNYLEGTVVTKEKIDYAEKLCLAHFGYNLFNRQMWEHILVNHGGRLPVLIKAVPEGTLVPVNNVMMTVENTDEKCAPLTNHLETLLSQIWAPCTVATLSYETKKLIRFYLDETANNHNSLMFQLHDFGFRGVSSVEAAGIEGAGHLINFMGTDTLRAIEVACEYYSADIDKVGYSVCATEHSVMTSYGRDGEEMLFDQLLTTHPKGILSVVIDSYDYRNFINMTRTFKNKILERDGKVVFRPDSGDPNTVTIDVLNLLSDIFGYTVNSKGYKVLHPKIGVLWGDGIDYKGVRDILFTMKNNKYSAENIVFGMGGGLLQKINRDTQRFAFKCSAQKRDGRWYDISKNPIDASKKSKQGRLCLVKDSNGYRTENVGHSLSADCLVPVFENGKILKEYSFEEVRNNTKNE